MKTKTPHVLTLGAALLLAPLTSTLAQSTWQTTDALTPYRGRAIVADAAGNFISLAIDDSTSSTGPVTTAVSLSSDTGLTWQTVGLIPGYALKLTAVPDGTLYASGNRAATRFGQAYVWQSVDHGATWTVSNPWSGQTTSFISMDLAAGNSGAVYLCGYIFGGNKWVVRKGLPSPTGLTWSTVDNYPTTGGSQPTCVSVRPATALGQADEVFVCGIANGFWTVRHSPDGGATWKNLDSYSSGRYVGGSAVAVAPDGSIYFVLPTVKTVGTSYQYGWLVRKSSNGGASWANVDSFANATPAPAAISVDVFGRVFVAGIGNYGTALAQTWVVRGSANGGATWTTTDSFLPAGYTGSQAFGAASDAFGNVCVIGDVENGTPSADLAPVRRLATP